MIYFPILVAERLYDSMEIQVNSLAKTLSTLDDLGQSVIDEHIDAPHILAEKL